MSFRFVVVDLCLLPLRLPCTPYGGLVTTSRTSARGTTSATAVSRLSSLVSLDFVVLFFLRVVFFFFVMAPWVGGARDVCLRITPGVRQGLCLPLRVEESLALPVPLMSQFGWIASERNWVGLVSI